MVVGDFPFFSRRCDKRMADESMRLSVFVEKFWFARREKVHIKVTNRSNRRRMRLTMR